MLDAGESVFDSVNLLLASMPLAESLAGECLKRKHTIRLRYGLAAVVAFG